jgi:hypothetical protein
MPPPAPTELLNQDLKRLVAAVDKLAEKVGGERKDFHEFGLDITKQLGLLNERIASIQTTLRLAGAALAIAVTIAVYVSRNAYQTVFSEGEKVGTLQAKVDMIEKALHEQLSKPTQPTIDGRPVPDPIPRPKDGSHPPNPGSQGQG